MPTTRVAILDDYQSVAMESADWSTLPQGAQVEVFKDHLADTGALVGPASRGGSGLI